MRKLLPILLLAGSTFLAGCGDSEEYVFTNNNNNVIGVNAPVARDDAYTTTLNTAVAIPAATGVLANDTLNGGNIAVTFPTTTGQGGTVSFSDNAGAFTYTPGNGFQGVDSFAYTLSNGYGVSTAVVTITVGAVVPTQGIFVDSVNGNDASGNAATGSPFRTIQAAVTAAGANTTIVVRPGNYTGAVNLLNGQRLIGSGSALVNAQGTTRPVLTGPVVLADGNTLDFLRIQGTAASAIDGDDQNGGTITNCQIASTTNTGSGIRAQSVTGTWRITNNTISSVAGLGIEVRAGLGDSATAFVNSNNISGSAFDGLGFLAEDDGRLNVQSNNNILTGNARGASYEVISLDTGVVTLQITGNQNDDVYLFSRTDQTSAIRIENFATLSTRNTGRVVVDLLPVTDITSAGF